jgi:ELWxxDGT repeat protein
MQRPQPKWQPWRYELMKFKRLCLFFNYIFTIIILSLCNPLFAQTPYLVKDINQSQLINLNKINGFAETDIYACFFADDGFHGEELWITDGTTHGTRLLKDIFPGVQGSGIGPAIQFCRVGNELYFPIGLSGAGDYNSEIWKTDGTPEGTVPVFELPDDTHIAAEITALGNKVLFKVWGYNSTIYTLWVSDGTQAGTTPIKQFNSPGNPLSFISYQNGLLFAAATQGEGVELWKTDGTIDGTVLVKDIYPGSNGSFPTNFTKVKDKVFFRSNHPNYGNQIWMTDGTANGTSLLKELKAGSGSASPDNLLALNDSLYFLAFNQSFQRILWSSDGSANNTNPVKNSIQGQQPPKIDGIKVCDSFLIASVYKENSWELWRKNGNDSKYFKFKEQIVAGEYLNIIFNNWISSANQSFFSHYSGLDNFELLWKTDGTEEGTQILRKIEGPAGGYPEIFGFSVFANDLYFSSLSLNNNVPVWKSDGTPSGTIIIKELRDDELSNFNPSFAYPVEDTLFFMANKEEITRSELWRTEGVHKNTRKAMEIDKEFTLLKSFGGSLYLGFTNESNENELWKYNTDGTIKTKLIGGLNGVLGKFFECKGKLYFTASIWMKGEEVWVTDGTSGGTKMLIENDQATGYSNVLSFNESDNHLFILINKSLNNVGLWAVDLITNLPVLIKEMPYGYYSYSAAALGVKAGELYFIQNRFTYPFSTELWKSNGTSIGTLKVGTIPIFIETINSGPILFKDHFYFSGENETNGNELWRTDGTVEGTTLVKDINTSPSTHSYVINLHKFDSLLLFFAETRETGYELWRTDGTEAGTYMIKDLHAGNIGFNLTAGFFTYNGKAYFGTQTEFSQKLWVTDGTSNGTFSVPALDENTGYILPYEFFSTNSTLFATANSYYNQKGYGSELWSFSLCSDSIKPLPTASDISFNHQPINDSISCRCNISGELMEKVISHGSKPVTGAIHSKIWIQENAPTGYVNKVYEIFPENKDSVATGIAILYYSQEDFDSFNEIHDKKLPSNPNDSIGIKNLHVELRKGESINGSGLPVSFKKQIETIQPNIAKIKWDSAKSRWEIEVTVTGGFGGFFVKADSCLLSESFTWRGNNSDNWENENNWLEKAKPSIGANIIIPSNRRYYPLISTNISVRKLQLEKGATLKINAGVVIEINDKICR